MQDLIAEQRTYKNGKLSPRAYTPTGMYHSSSISAPVSPQYHMSPAAGFGSIQVAPYAAFPATSHAIVAAPIEVPVEKIVTQRVDVPVEKIVEKYVEVPVDKIVEKVVTRSGGEKQGSEDLRSTTRSSQLSHLTLLP
jgi:hypothetical protein